MLNSLQGRECEIVFEHLRKDTISREGSYFYQPLSLTLHPLGGNNIWLISSLPFFASLSMINYFIYSTSQRFQQHPYGLLQLTLWNLQP